MAHEQHETLRLLDKPFAVMGVLNVTPDSFYDGGRYAAPQAAHRQALRLVGDGADIIDVGGESTRPGARPVSAEEEMSRVIPVIEHICRNADVVVSIDTTKAAVAREALRAGAAWINDISAGRADQAMPALAAEKNCPVVLMHSRKTPQDMQVNPHYENVVEEVRSELSESVELFLRHGVSRRNIIVDPGIGFAKRFEDNLVLLRELPALSALGCPILVGASRKSFIGIVTGRDANERLAGSLACVGAAFLKGAKLFRVHDVKETADFLKVMSAIEHG
jgi:dihydropteroate synthase